MTLQVNALGDDLFDMPIGLKGVDYYCDYPESCATILDFRALFECIPGLYLVLEPTADFTIIAASNAYLHATNIERQNVLGHRLFDVFPDNPSDPTATGVANLTASLERVLLNRQPDAMAVQKYDIRTVEGEDVFEERYWSPLNSPVLNERGEVQYIIHRVDDVTEYVRLKQRGNQSDQLTQELSRRAEEMQAEIIARGQQLQEVNEKLRAANEVLQQAKAEAERANHAKSEFLSRMSHELRTPLNSILGFAQLLELADLNSEQADNVNHILRGGRHLLDLINEILDLARIEAGRLSLSAEPVQIRETLRDALDVVRPIAEQQNVHLAAEGALRCQHHVLADRQRLKQVLINLLANAIKFNRKGGTVTLSCYPIANDHLRVEIADTGIGMSEEDIQKLFQPFERLKSDEAGVSGTGLGLVLCKRLIEAMGGSIGVQSSVGIGSRFYFELGIAEHPIEQPENQPEQIAHTAEKGTASRRGTILYVEDNLSNVRLMERIISSYADVRLLVAMQSELALELAKAHTPDWILLDVHLPDMPGDEVLRRLRQSPETKDIPVTVVSADATARQIRRLMDAGARDYLTKPFNVKELISLLEATLESRPSSAELGAVHGKRNPSE